MFSNVYLQLQITLLTSLIKTDSKDTTTFLACILRVKVPHAINYIMYHAMLSSTLTQCTVHAA